VSYDKNNAVARGVEVTAKGGGGRLQAACSCFPPDGLISVRESD
jgi:hypothetical protein